MPVFHTWNCPVWRHLVRPGIRIAVQRPAQRAWNVERRTNLKLLGYTRLTVTNTLGRRPVSLKRKERRSFSSSRGC